MSYRQSSYTGAPMKIGALVAALALGKIVWPQIQPYISAQTQMMELSSASGTDDALISDVGIGPLMKTLKARFPKDYAQLLLTVRAAAAKNDQAAVVKAVNDSLITILRRDGKFIAEAPHSALARLETAQLAVVESLRAQPEKCTRFANNVLQGEDFTPNLRAAMSNISEARLVAMAEGRDGPAGRASFPIDAETARTFIATVDAARIPADSRELLLGERTAEHATDEAQCEAQYHLLKGVQKMPNEKGDRVYTSFITG